MSTDPGPVRITAHDITAAVPLIEFDATWTGDTKTTSLHFSSKDPSWFAKKFGGGKDALTVDVEPAPVDGGAPLWGTQVRFPKGKVQDAFDRVGLEWPVWWAVGVGEISTLVEKMGLRMLTFSGFARPEVALPWFVRLHAAATGGDPAEPVVVTRTTHDTASAGYRDVDDGLDLWHAIGREEYSDATKLQEYEAWLEREAQWKRANP